jgi:hypothetical protein
MTVTYLSAAAVGHAEQTQDDHKAAADGWWCGFCLRHSRIRVRAGECQPYRQAAVVIGTYLNQQSRRRPPARPIDRGSVSR